MTAPPPLVTSAPALPAAEAVAGLQGPVLRGGAVTLASQACKFVLSLASTVALARLLAPSDYGLVAMAAAFTGLVEVFRDGGLSLATFQRARLDDARLATLCWLNVGLGAVLAALTAAVAPLIADFYHEPELAGITAALGLAFLFGGVGVQSTALLRRDLRFATVAVIEIAAAGAGVAAALLLSWRGAGPWALVALTVIPAFVASAGAWAARPVRLVRPAPLAAVRPLLAFGAGIMATRLLFQVVRGAPNALLGWAWGSAATGLYHRAFSLLMVAVDQIQTPLAAAALPPLSRLAEERARLRRAFLLTYRVEVAVIVPLVMTIAVFAEELVALLLGPHWEETAPILRWLALGGVGLALLHPQGLLLLALGRADRGAVIATVDAVVVVAGCMAGLAGGAGGVALGYGVAKLLLVVPLTIATFRRTPVGWREVLDTARNPLAAALFAASVGLAVKFALADDAPPSAVAVVGSTLTLGAYAAALLFISGEWPFYRGLLRELRNRRPLPAP